MRRRGKRAGRAHVSDVKTIAAVGISEQEVAHLRLLLRKCVDALTCAWRWGDEDGADFIVVDPDVFAGQMARTRAVGAGIRCAVFSDRPVEGADLVLQRPLRRDNLVEVLNRASASAVTHTDIASVVGSEDFYSADLGDDAAPASAHVDLAAPAGGLDDALRAEPLELRAMTARDAPVARAAIPADRKYATREAMLEDTAPRELREFLDGELLRMPARYALPGAPALTLDPKNKVAHAPAGLGALAPYAQARWRLCDFQRLTGTELAEIRAEQQSHSYARLVWLCVLLNSGGHLARHLDPGGTYRITQWIEIEKDLVRYFRIGKALLTPVRLHEVAAAAAAPMADVFDVVNAYDAIGLLEWQPRARREAPAPAPSLMAKLKKPWGRSYR